MPYPVTRTLSALLLSIAALSVFSGPTRAATRPARLDYTMTTLGNGMQVVFLEDH